MLGEKRAERFDSVEAEGVVGKVDGCKVREGEEGGKKCI